MSRPPQIPWRKRATLEARSPSLARERRLLRLVDFGNKVKIRFQCRQDVYAAFCETCSLTEEKGEEWVFEKLRVLFADDEDLIAEFVELQAEGSARPIDGAGGSAGREAFSGVGNKLAVVNTGEKPQIKGEEPSSSSLAPVENARKSVLFRCEDHMCNLDVMIGLVRSAMSRIGSSMAAGCTEGCRLTAGELRCVRMIYGSQGAEMVEFVREDPGRALPLVLSRLQQKQDEWVACRADARKVWKKVFAEHHRPSLGRVDTKTTTATAKTMTDAGSTGLCHLVEVGEEAPEQAEQRFFGKSLGWWALEAERGKRLPA